ncbi:hypothetical protein ACWD4Z_22895 [Streptomyces antibioticus]
MALPLDLAHHHRRLTMGYHRSARNIRFEWIPPHDHLLAPDPTTRTYTCAVHACGYVMHQDDFKGIRLLDERSPHAHARTPPMHDERMPGHSRTRLGQVR